MKVTSVSGPIPDNRMVIQLHGENGEDGYAVLNLPLNQPKAFQVGDEWTLEPSKDEIVTGPVLDFNSGSRRKFNLDEFDYEDREI
jgi:hypothetical protein